MKDRIIPAGYRLLPSAAVAVCLLSASCANLHMEPPIAAVRPHATSIHGITRVDNYHWLRDRESSEVINYLEAENRYTDAKMKHTEPLQKRLFREMKGRLKETDLTVPTRRDDYYYYKRTFEGKQYPVHCRKRGSLDGGEEEILLDVNRLAEAKKYFRLGVFRVSPDHRLLAYSTDTEGSETYRIFVKNLATGSMMLDEIPNTYYGVAWANDNRTIFYTTLDDAMRPYKLFRHTLGTDPARDVLIHHEKDERYFVNISRTRSRAYLLMSLRSTLTSEVWYLDADRPDGDFQVIHPREQGLEYKVEHHGESFYITTNEAAINFKLVKAPVSSPGKGNWTQVIGHRPDVKLDGVDAFRDRLAVYERAGGLRILRIMELDTGRAHQVDFPEPVYTFYATGNDEFNTTQLRFSYTSLVTPDSVYDYDMKSRTRTLLKREEVLGGFDPSRYRSERIFAIASDGTKVPISLVYRKGIARDGGNPTLLAGYGSYGASYDPEFSSERLSLLDRDLIYAIAHIRGGGDLGRPWYEDGKLLNKRNTFTDFIACAEHLIAAGYTSPDRLAITGGSAGGLLMGAVTNMRPDLFKAVVARVPFVDVINTMLDPSIPLTVTEFEEWGNPTIKAHFDYMMTYSPYDNVTPQNYPNLLITAGLNDPRVQYWEPAKWTAKMRATAASHNRLLLRTNMGAGHGGASGRYDALKEKAFRYAFILDVLGIPG